MTLLRPAGIISRRDESAGNPSQGARKMSKSGGMSWDWVGCGGTGATEGWGCWVSWCGDAIGVGSRNRWWVVGGVLDSYHESKGQQCPPPRAPTSGLECVVRPQAGRGDGSGKGNGWREACVDASGGLQRGVGVGVVDAEGSIPGHAPLGDTQS